MIRALLLVLGALAQEPAEPVPASLPLALDGPAMVLPSAVERSLPGGARLWSVERPGELLALELLSSLPPEAVDGRTRQGLGLLPALLDEGARGWESGGVDAAFEPLGASLLLAPEPAGLRLRLLAPPEAAEPALALLAELLERPALPRATLRRERAAWRERERGVRSSASRWMHRAERRAVYPEGHPLASWPDPGQRVSRRGVAGTYERLLAEGGAHLVLVAPEPEAMAPLLARAFPRLGAPPAEAALAPATLPTEGPAVVLLHSPGATQLRVVVSWPVPDDVTRAQARLLAELLGGGSTGRLERRLRDELGLVYEARASLVEEPGHARLRVTTRLDGLAPGLGLEALQGVLNEPLRLEPGELERARDQRLFTAARDWDELVRGSARLREQAALGLGPEAWAELLAGMEGVVPAEIEAAAAELLAPERATWVLLGDAELVEPALEASGLGVTRIEGLRLGE